MKNEYVSNVMLAILESKHKIIMVFQNKLTDEDIKFIADLAIDNNKTVIFASMQAILFNNNENILVVKE